MDLLSLSDSLDRMALAGQYGSTGPDSCWHCGHEGANKGFSVLEAARLSVFKAGKGLLAVPLLFLKLIQYSISNMQNLPFPATTEHLGT